MSRPSASDLSSLFKAMGLHPPEGAPLADAPRYAVAVDFGTARSGLAFGIFLAPDSVTAHQAFPNTLAGQKTRTDLLLRRSDLSVRAFGDDATHQFTEMVDSEKKDVLLFHQFKMQLYDEAGGRMRPSVPAYNDATVRVPVVTLIARALEYMRIEALRYLDTRYPLDNGAKISVADVQWMVTVPTVWSDAGKQMMREAAVQSGLISDMSSRRLSFALEPEAASIWCRRQMDLDQLHMKKGDKFIIMDCGGGTVDTVVMQVAEGGGSHMLASGGGPWGSKGINERFEKFIGELVETAVYETFCRTAPHEHYVFMDNFERNTKHRLKPFSDYGPNEAIIVRLPQELKDVCEEEMEGVSLADLCQKYSDQHNLSGSQRLKCSARGFQLEMPASLVKSLFQPLLDQIADHARGLVIQHPDVQYFLLVGGFAACPPLVRAIEDVCEGVVRVTTTQDPALAVVLGAALQQLNSPTDQRITEAGHVAVPRNVILSHRMPRTYGVKSNTRWTSAHASDGQPKATILNDKSGKMEDYCSVFSVFKRSGEQVNTGEVVSHKFVPTTSKTSIQMMRTDKTNPKYPDEEGVTRAAQLIITLPPNKPGQYFTDRTIRVDMLFGSAEITMTATEVETNTSVHCTLDFIIE